MDTDKSKSANWFGSLLVVVLIVGFLLVNWVKVSADKSKFNAYPEVVTSSPTGSVKLDFDLKINGKLPIISANAKSLDNNLITKLVKNKNGGFKGSLEVKSLSKAQTLNFVLYLNGIKTERSIRVAITDISMSLPADPGEEGKQTLTGIDSDKDGVRDDVQREIVFMYPDRDEVRRVLRGMVKREQAVITTEGDHDYYKDLMISALTMWDCQKYLVFGNDAGNYDKVNELWNLVQNTKERKQSFIANDTKAKPYSVTLYGTKASCSQSLE